MTTRPSIRARIDWGAARAYFVALNPPRTYAAVARRFNVSVTAVRNHAIPEGWAELATQADAEAAEKALRRSFKTRDERVAAVLVLADGLVDYFTENVAAKGSAATVSDLVQLVKLTELLLGEATDRVAASEVQHALVLVMSAGPELAAELVAAGLKGEQLVRAFRERYPQIVQERIAIAAGGEGDA